MYDAKEYQHCKVINAKLTAGGRANPNPGVECIHCLAHFSGGPSRIRGHILGINCRGGGACTADDRAAQNAKVYFQKVEDDQAASKEKKRKREELDELTNGSGTGASFDGLVQLTIPESLAPCLKDKADQAVARFVMGEGVPFVKTESVYFRDMLAAVADYGPGYRPPSVKRLRTTLLDQEVENVKEQLKVRGLHRDELHPYSTYFRTLTVDSISKLCHVVQPFQEEMHKAKCSGASDGWQDACKRPLLNVCATTTAGTTFIKAVDTTGKTKVMLNSNFLLWTWWALGHGCKMMVCLSTMIACRLQSTSQMCGLRPLRRLALRM